MMNMYDKTGILFLRKTSEADYTQKKYGKAGSNQQKSFASKLKKYELLYKLIFLPCFSLLLRLF